MSYNCHATVKSSLLLSLIEEVRKQLSQEISDRILYLNTLPRQRTFIKRFFKRKGKETLPLSCDFLYLALKRKLKKLEKVERLCYLSENVNIAANTIEYFGIDIDTIKNIRGLTDE